MDISKIDDLDKLKALAWDQIVLRDQAVNNLNIINTRMQEMADAQLTARTPAPIPKKEAKE